MSEIQMVKLTKRWRAAFQRTHWLLRGVPSCKCYDAEQDDPSKANESREYWRLMVSVALRVFREVRRTESDSPAFVKRR